MPSDLETVAADVRRFEGMVHRLFDERGARTEDRLHEAEKVRKEVREGIRGLREEHGELLKAWQDASKMLEVVARSMKQSERDRKRVERGSPLEMSTGSRSEVVWSGLRKYDTSSALTDEAIAREKAEEIQELEVGIREIHGMYEDAHKLVHEQGPKLQAAKQNIVASQEKVQQGTAELQQSRKYKRFLFF
eukprot:TRINITY_DN29281_c0_g1_i1.p1 TRINITY_DN29281_c0_g1~~TRINITY_DN29281_c0_g1_i1.p1  ORF type:complete len:206 (+),score=62.05 TRINITY_DN29281_c0_g1_i1:48-620(+)